MILLLLAAQTVVENDSPRFRVRIPSGYALVREDLPKGRFYLKERRPGERFVITVTLWPGELAEGAVERNQAALKAEFREVFPGGAEPGMSLRRLPWRGYEVEGVDVRCAREGRPLFLSTAFVPLSGQAVRLEVLGPAAGESEVQADLRELLDSLEGRSSWLRPDQRVMMGWVPVVGVTPFFGAGVNVLAWLLFFRRRPAFLFWPRTLFMLSMGLLSLLPPLLWSLSLSDTNIQPPVICTWPAPLFLAAPWLMLASARLAARLRGRPPEPGAA